MTDQHLKNPERWHTIGLEHDMVLPAQLAATEMLAELEGKQSRPADRRSR